MAVLNDVVSKCITCSYMRKSSSSVVVASKTQIPFSNKGHLDYYGEANKVKKKGMNGVGVSLSTKKKIKLLKNFSTFSDLASGFNFDSQAEAEVLLAQLKKLRTEEKKLKKKQKKDKESKNKNSNCASSSSSSSSESESSDSECDKTVDIKRSIVQQNQTYSSSTSNLPAIRGPTNEQQQQQTSLNLDQECSNMILEATLNKDAPIQLLNLKQYDMGKRIDVCMGGKCKKSGAPALLQELQKSIGDDGAVIGCKCMGKCKTAPNVKVSTAQALGDDDSLRYPTNPLYIGVGLEDVERIVARYFEEGIGLPISL